MKIELDLTTLNTETSIQAAAAGVVAIMRMLPDDEVQLAIAEWVAGRKVEQEADRQAAPTPAMDELRGLVRRLDVMREAIDQGEPQSQQEPPQPEPTPHPEPEPWSPELKPDGRPGQEAGREFFEENVSRETVSEAKPAKPSYEKFIYGDRSFSTHKRGPTAALNQAFADIIGETDPAKLLGPLSLKLANLVGIFEEIGRKDLAGQIAPALEKRKAELAGVTQQPSEDRLVPRWSEPAGDVDDVGDVDDADAPKEAQPEPVKLQPSAAPKGTVPYAGKQVRPVVARSMCLKHISACTTIEKIDQLSREADQLADLLDEMGEGTFASAIRTLLSEKTEKLAEADAVADADVEIALTLAKAETPSAEAPSQATTAQPVSSARGNGSNEPETLRHLLRRAEHRLGRIWVNKLLKQHGASSGHIKELDKAKEPAVRAAALEALDRAAALEALDKAAAREALAKTR